MSHAAAVVQAEFTVAGFLFVEDHPAINRFKRVQAGVVFRGTGVARQLGDTVDVRGEAGATEGANLEIFGAETVAIAQQFVDPVLTGATKGSGNATLAGNAVTQGFGASPAAVAVNHRVIQPAGNVEDASGSLAADVVGFNHHLAANQLLDQEIAQVRQASAVTQVFSTLARVQRSQLFRGFREAVTDVVHLEQQLKIGRASCRERVEITVVAVGFKE